MNALERFNKYDTIWSKERDEELEQFMKEDPHLSEFEGQVFYYEGLEREIMAEAEHYDVGPIALYTGKGYIGFIFWLWINTIYMYMYTWGVMAWQFLVK